MIDRRLRFLEWLDARTGYQTGLSHLLDEPLPSGVSWWFTLGSVLLFLLLVQWLTGIVLTIYYVPTPDHAYESLRFLLDEVTFGRLVRALHFFGASFIVVVAVAHLSRVFLFGAYKKPRELTWITGVALLLVILAFGLSGYLLPWDQRAYWATTVTVSIARSAPLVGPAFAALIQGGRELGALTLSRWYAAHVILLPAALVALIVTHLFLMRRHGVAGPIQPREGPSKPFYPFHAIKDMTAVAVVFALLLVLSIFGHAPLDLRADPTDSTYIPRPEWYFLGLFQLLKYFPGRLEPVAAIGIPMLLVALLVLLPFLDRGPQRALGTRRAVLIPGGLVMIVVTVLTILGWRDSPASPDPARWPPSAIAGQALSADDRCTRCHTPDGTGPDLATAVLTKDDQWILGHISDPDMIAPGLRPLPAGTFTRAQADAVVAFVRRTRAGAPRPVVTPEERLASIVFALHCARCHRVDGVGGDEGPDLSRAGEKRDREWILTYTRDPSIIDANATMPAFEDKLTPVELEAIANYLAGRK